VNRAPGNSKDHLQYGLVARLHDQVVHLAEVDDCNVEGAVGRRHSGVGGGRDDFDGGRHARAGAEANMRKLQYTNLAESG
jgi:hypothetical protein